MAVSFPTPELAAESQLHRAYVGPRDEYDVGAAHQFNLLTSLLGMREYHQLLEIGCGSLRAARLFIPYLLPERYHGLEPNRWLVEAGLKHELGDSLLLARRPAFEFNATFDLACFGDTFDFILAQSIFSHTSQEQLLACLRSAQQVLKPEGIFAASYHAADEDYEGHSWVYPESVTFRPDTFARLCAEAGLACQSISWGNQNNQTWMLMYHPSRSLPLPVLSDADALRLEVSVLRRKLETLQRGGISPVEHARLIERFQAVIGHPAVVAAAHVHADLHRLISDDAGSDAPGRGAPTAP